MPFNDTKEYYRDNKLLKRQGVTLNYTPEQVAEYVKCSQDAIYFINKYVKIVTLDEGVVPFKLWPFQKKLIHLLHKERFVIGKLLRQVGKTSTVIAYFVWLTTFTDDLNILIAANKRQTAEDILQKYKLSYENVPVWMQQGVIEWNKGNIVLENGSKIRASSTTSGAARSGSYNCVVGDTLVQAKIDGIEQEISIIDLLHMINTDEQIHLGEASKMTNSLFLNNKYTKWYYNLVNKAQLENRNKDEGVYYENHHIIPKSLEGTNEKTNLVLLTPREHFVAHKFLLKITEGKNKAKMASALWMMLKGTNKIHFKFASTHDYERVRLGHLEAIKITLNNKDRIISDKTRKKQSDSSPFKGKKRPKEFGQNLSNKLTGHKKSDEWVDKINRNPEKIRKTAEKHKGMKRTKETKDKMAAAKEGYIPWNKGKTNTSQKGVKWFHNPITKETIMCLPENKPDGYINGRK